MQDGRFVDLLWRFLKGTLIVACSRSPARVFRKVAFCHRWTKAADHPITSGRRAARLAGRTRRAAGRSLFPHRPAVSREALEHRLARYVEIAARDCLSLKRQRVTLDVLRHTAAMRLLRAGVDPSVIALWLGHEHLETTHVYLHADLELKERTLAKTTPANTAPGRYWPPDSFSRSSRRSDYADPIAAIPAPKAEFQATVGIIRTSE